MTVIRAADMTLTDADVRRAGALFGVDDLERLGGFENALYRAPGRVVRITHTSRRSVTLVEGEFAFMATLAEHQVPVVAPVLSEHGRLVEELTTDDGETVVVACMTEAEGGMRLPDDWSDADIETYGATLGAMHEAARHVAPATPRPAWPDPIFDVGLADARDTHPDLYARNEEIKADLAAHPAGGTGLLIHQDAHFGNLFMTDDGRITVFDFDDCGWGTATHDVAIVLFYWLLGREVDAVDETRRFFRHFLRGYERYATLPSDWPEGADRVLAYREMDIYWLVSIENEEDSNAWELRFMEGRRDRILEGVPYVGRPLAEVLA